MSRQKLAFQNPPRKDDFPPIMTRKQAAAYLGISLAFFDRLVKQGLIPCWTVPGSKLRRFSREALDKLARGESVAA